MIANDPVLLLPLDMVVRPEIARPMEHVFRLYTVGSFLVAWNDPRKQRYLERLFETPQQAHHAAATCAAWAGLRDQPPAFDVGRWWRSDGDEPVQRKSA